MAVKLQVRRGPSLEWSTVNPVLMEGELGLELDTDKWKIGNGVDAWDIRPYAPQGMRGERGEKGEKGDTPLITYQNIIDGLGYIPENELNIGELESLVTDNKIDIVGAINEVKTQSNENATDILNKASKVMGETFSAPLQNGFTAGVGTPNGMLYSKNDLGQVWVRAYIIVGSTVADGTVVATLPTGYRPSSNHIFADVNFANSKSPTSLLVRFDNGNVVISGNTLIAGNGIRVNALFQA